MADRREEILARLCMALDNVMVHRHEVDAFVPGLILNRPRIQRQSE
jgi:hypothetical protein